MPVIFCLLTSSSIVISDISVLKFISVSVSISFLVNHFYFYIISVFIPTIISVFISFYNNHFYFIIYQYCRKQLFQFYVVLTKLFKPHFALTNSWLSAFNSQHLVNTAYKIANSVRISSDLFILLRHPDGSSPQTKKIRGPQYTNYGRGGGGGGVSQIKRCVWVSGAGG